MNVVDVVDHFYIALLSAFEQTHCTVAAESAMYINNQSASTFLEQPFCQNWYS